MAKFPTVLSRLVSARSFSTHCRGAESAVGAAPAGLLRPIAPAEQISLGTGLWLRRHWYVEASSPFKMGGMRQMKLNRFGARADHPPPPPPQVRASFESGMRATRKRPSPVRAQS